MFGHKTRWDRLREVAAATAASLGTRQVGKVTLGVVGGAVAATVASAAVSAARHGDDS
jgi:hypothetical protein